MATLTEQLEMAEQLLFKNSVNEALDVLNKISKKATSYKHKNVRPLVSSFKYILQLLNMYFLLTVSAPNEDDKEEAIKLKEIAILKLGETLAKHQMAEGFKFYGCGYQCHYIL